MAIVPAITDKIANPKSKSLTLSIVFSLLRNNNFLSRSIIDIAKDMSLLFGLSKEFMVLSQIKLD